MSKKKRLVLIDANSIVHRAYHAYPSQLATTSGEQTNAIYGFSFLLLKMIEDLEPDYLICAFDVAKPTVRHKKFADYKKHRKPHDKELLDQFPRVKEVLKAFDIPIFEAEGFEGDDVIGTVESDRRVKNFEKVVVTGDQDIFQLVDKDTRVYLSGRNFRDSKLYGVSDVVKKLGITPDQVTDYKALCGDPSDNIPGVSGIGKLGAFKLIQKYKSLDGVYQNIDKIEGRYQNKLRGGKDQAYMSRELATIIKDVPLSIDFKSCKWGEFDADKVRKIFQDLEFRSLLKKLDQMRQDTPELIKVDIPKEISKGTAKTLMITRRGELREFVKEIEKQSAFAISFEGRGESCVDLIPQSLAFYWGDEAYCIGVDLLKSKSKFTSEGRRIIKILQDGNSLKIGHDLKSLVHALRNFGIELHGLFFDVQIAAYLIQKGNGSTRLGYLAFNYLGQVFDREEQQSLTGFGDSSSNLGEEVRVMWKLYEEFLSKLKGADTKGGWNLTRLFHEIEAPLILVLARMECNGILIDKKYLTEFAKNLDNNIRKVQKEAFKCVGHEFDINSPKQVSEVLFEELDLPKSRRGKSGQYSTSKGILEDLKGTHPVVESILKCRELTKLRSTYTDSLSDAISSRTGRIHSTFNQAVTATGRLSSTDPNLQNIPISTDLGRQIRRAFIVKRGWSLVSFDYSQQELRILAHLAGERNLIEAFAKDEDVHALTASKVFDKDMSEITKKERQIGKTINFGVMYGMSAHGLSSMLKIDFSTAQEFIGRYFEEYSALQAFFEEYLESARRKGYAETIFGRQRVASGLKASNVSVKNASIRELINFPIQGSAADMMKLAMIRVDDLVQREFKDKAKMILQIHDELVFEFKGKRELKKFVKEVTEIMENVYRLKVSLKVDFYTGSNLEEVH